MLTPAHERARARMTELAQGLQPSAPEGPPGRKETNPFLYKTETDFGDLQIIVLSRIFVQNIILSFSFREYRISTREF